MTISRIHHVQITVPRGAEAAARRFYCEILGLQEIEKPVELRGRGGLWLRIADQAVHIGVEDGVDRSTTKAHVAYQVVELKQWRSKLEATGIQILDSAPIPGWGRGGFRDPFGNRGGVMAPL